MIHQKNNILEVNVGDNTGIGGTDYTKEASKWTSNPFTATITPTNYLYIGYKKNISQYYIEIATVNTNASTLIVESYNGTAWVTIDHYDETDGLTKSGFLYLEQDHAGEAHNGGSNFIRVSCDVDTSAVEINGLNLSFCSSDDILNEEPASSSFIPRGYSSHILSQEAAVNYIMRKINNSGTYKYNGTDVSTLSRFDLFDINEVRDAATFYTLHKIFSNRSDELDDVYSQKSADYLAKFNNSFQIFVGSKLTLDLDDDGTEDDDETVESTTETRFKR